MDKKLFAIIDEGKIIDAWLADSLEEAQEDNIGKTVIEMTIENSPQTIGKEWKER